MTIRTSLKSALFGAAALAMAATGALADQLADIKAAGKIVTATDMHYAPFDMLNNGTYEGMTKDLFDEVAKEIGVEPVYQDIPWTAELPGLEVGKFDIVIAPVTVTAERLERYTFTPPIADATVSLVKAASNKDLTKPEDIKGKTVGVQQGTAQFRQLDAYGKELGGVTVKEYGTTDEAYADLAAGRLDAAMTEELAPLKMERAVFETRVTEGEPGPEGRDGVAFTVATNPGAPPGPLDR